MTTKKFYDRCLCCGCLLEGERQTSGEGMCENCEQEFQDMEIERKKRTPKSGSIQLLLFGGDEPF